MLPEVKALIEYFGFNPMPVENTLFVSTYRADRELADNEPIGTAMLGLYCEEPRSVSLFHKLPADEIWHFYLGDPLRLILLYPDGSSKDVIMGNAPLKGQHVQFVVPAGVWQAGHLLAGGKYALYGCTMAPGFIDTMFQGGTYEELVAVYPDRADDLTLLSCDTGLTQMPQGFAE